MREHDEDENFREWIRELDEDVIQGEYGFVEGEFAVFPELWWPFYNKGLTPKRAYERALNAYFEVE